MSKFKIPDDDHLDLRFLPGESTYSTTPFDSYPFFSYQYLNIHTIPDYCFNHNDFLQEDFFSYFQKVKEFSSQRIGDIENHRFKISRHNAAILSLFKTAVGITRKLGDDEIPEFGHFHLSDVKKENGSKRPVIHFFVGQHGVLYILCYDPYHEIHKTTY